MQPGPKLSDLLVLTILYFMELTRKLLFRKKVEVIPGASPISGTREISCDVIKQGTH